MGQQLTMNFLKRIVLCLFLSLAVMAVSGKDLMQEVKDMFDGRMAHTETKLKVIRKQLADHETRRRRLHTKAYTKLNEEHQSLKSSLLKMHQMRKKEIERVASLNRQN